MNHSNEIREKIKKELINLEYDISLCGTLYLSECLYIIINRKIEGILNLKKRNLSNCSREISKGCE